jgi:hypothetical protein
MDIERVCVGKSFTFVFYVRTFMQEEVLLVTVIQYLVD